VSDTANIIPDNWIVVLKEGTDLLAHIAGLDEAIRARTKSPFQIGSLIGYSGVFKASQLAHLTAIQEV